MVYVYININISIYDPVIKGGLVCPCFHEKSCGEGQTGILKRLECIYVRFSKQVKINVGVPRLKSETSSNLILVLNLTTVINVSLDDDPTEVFIKGTKCAARLLLLLTFMILQPNIRSFRL